MVVYLNCLPLVEIWWGYVRVKNITHQIFSRWMIIHLQSLFIKSYQMWIFFFFNRVFYLWHRLLQASRFLFNNFFSIPNFTSNQSILKNRDFFVDLYSCIRAIFTRKVKYNVCTRFWEKLLSVILMYLFSIYYLWAAVYFNKVNRLELVH